MGRKKKIRKDDLLEAIKDSYGIISRIASRLHVDWHTADDAIREHPEASRLLNDERESILDFTESKAIERIKDGDGAMIRFMLATKGKKRGYTYDETAATAEAAIADTEVNISVSGGEPAPAEADA